ncbi:unnamed protein product [Symbiodinium pilosum]|uniref:protein-serine/threonine phosphatase n=1 Tax=Symbiodinium pilosum TaxID=2952 RepID=A0A812WU12_SYMPI|nr:unnamed protein product [Symbiodinium pilosum]
MSMIAMDAFLRQLGNGLNSKGKSNLLQLSSPLGIMARHLEASSQRNAFNLVGSTAIVALVDKAGGRRTVTVANCGDSRAVLCRNGNAVELSEDHKPELNSEERRIRQAGGSVKLIGPCHRIDGWGLNLSRALGDFHYKARPDLSAEQQKVIAVPEIRTVELHSDDEFLVLACDGCFELHTSQKVVDIIRVALKAGQSVKQAAEELVDQSCSPNLVKTRGKDEGLVDASGHGDIVISDVAKLPDTSEDLQRQDEKLEQYTGAEIHAEPDESAASTASAAMLPKLWPAEPSCPELSEPLCLASIWLLGGFVSSFDLCNFSFAPLFGLEIAELATADLSCSSKTHEDWPSVHRRLLRLLEGQGGTQTLADELDRTAASFTQRLSHITDGLVGDCIPGQVSLDLLLLLSQPGLTDGYDVWREGGLLDVNWALLSNWGWPAVARSGWPIFRLLRLLQKPAQVHEAASALSGCNEEDAFSVALMNHVRHRHMHEALLAASADFILHGPRRCPLSVAAAYLSSAWARFPVFDEETEDLLSLAETHVRTLSLARILTTQHPLLDMLDDVASSYQAFMIDSGALYVDLRDDEALKVNESRVDYTRHMMAAESFTLQAETSACATSALTPLGRCNIFAPLGNLLLPWEKGISQEDTVRALRSTYQEGVPRALVFRLVESPAGTELRLLATPEASASEQLAECLAAKITGAVAGMLSDGMPRLEIVISLHAEAIFQRRTPRRWSPSYGRREDVPPPVFSFCSQGEAFWDIPLPPYLCYDFQPRCKSAKVVQIQLEEEEQRCYISRLLEGYADLLRYRPPGHAMEEQVLNIDDLVVADGALVRKSWPVKSSMSQQASQCDVLIAGAAA